MEIKLRKTPRGEVVTVTKQEPLSIEALMKEYSDELPYTVLAAKMNNKVVELRTMITEDSEIEFLDMRTQGVHLVYQYTLCLIYLKAIEDVLGKVPVQIQNSLNKGLYTEIRTPDGEVTEFDVQAIEERMREIVLADLPIEEEYVSSEEAIALLEERGYWEKVEILTDYTEITKPKFQSLGGYKNFFYGLMAPSTGYIELFELRKYRHGVILRFPYPSEPDKMPEFVDEKRLCAAFGESKKWHKLLNVSYLSHLNKAVESGRYKELILLSEALHEKKIAEIADMICSRKKRIVLIAGPSSSGKTTFAKRLCVQLKVNGLDPVYLGTDDYFVERCDTPKNEYGEYDYENLDAIDVNLFNDNMNRLLNGETVDLPRFDFITGTKQFGERFLSIRPHQPLVIEGIHGLNDALTPQIDQKQKFKIYISPFTQLNIDSHNRIPTTDARLLRRMVRDYRYRGYSAQKTISSWPKVRKGEDKNIFPYNGEADVMFNSALSYELAVLKKYAEPLLEAIRPDEPEYSEALRLLQFTHFVHPIEKEAAIQNNSIIREFIGGSIFVE